MPQQHKLEPVMTVEEVNALIAREFPQLNEMEEFYQAIEVFPGGCTVRLNATQRHLRPGGTVSGPALFTLADIGGYVCALSHGGPDALSVTTNLNINFLRKPSADAALVADASILKLGKLLVVCEVRVYSEGNAEPVAHATATYAIPPVRPAEATRASRGPRSA